MNLYQLEIKIMASTKDHTRVYYVLYMYTCTYVEKNEI